MYRHSAKPSLFQENERKTLINVFQVTEMHPNLSKRSHDFMKRQVPGANDKPVHAWHLKHEVMIKLEHIRAVRAVLPFFLPHHFVS
jgi:hypothetical protein